jgi:hypothetical protein
MGVLNITGTFDWKPPITVDEEIELINKGIWMPGSKDFDAVVGGNTVPCTGFDQVLGAILSQAKNSIDKINIFTHSNPTQIVFSGDLIQNQTLTDVTWTRYNQVPGLLSLDDFALAALNAPNQLFTVGKSTAHFTLEDVRERFTEDAIIFLFCCHSGTNPAFLQRVADTLRAQVFGFSAAMAYCPRFTPADHKTKTSATIDRKHIGINSCATFQDTDFNKIRDYAIKNNYVVWKAPSRPGERVINWARVKRREP